MVFHWFNLLFGIFFHCDGYLSNIAVGSNIFKRFCFFKITVTHFLEVFVYQLDKIYLVGQKEISTHVFFCQVPGAMWGAMSYVRREVRSKVLGEVQCPISPGGELCTTNKYSDLCSVKCEMWSMKCEVWSVLCEVKSCVVCGLQCLLYNLKCAHCVKYSLCILQCAVFSVQCAVRSKVFSMQCAVYSVLCAVFSLYSEIYNVQCALCSVLCTVCCVQCTVCSLQ